MIGFSTGSLSGIRLEELSSVEGHDANSRQTENGCDRWTFTLLEGVPFQLLLLEEKDHVVIMYDTKYL
jgi:hypothetical protein